jgi:hypothetical protein
VGVTDLRTEPQRVGVGALKWIPLRPQSRLSRCSARPRKLATQQSLRAQRPGDSGKTKSTRSSAHPAPSVLAEAKQAKWGQRGCSGRETEVLVMKAAEINGTGIVRFENGKIVEHCEGPHCMHAIGLLAEVEPPTKLSAEELYAKASAAKSSNR